MMRSFALALAVLSGAAAAQAPGTFLGTFPSPTTANPYGLGLGSGGNLLITGLGTPDEVHVMDTTGASLSSFTPTQSNFPYGVTTDGTSIYVVNSTPAQIDVYTTQGTHLRSIPTTGLTPAPRGLAYVSTSQHLFLVDGVRATPQCFELDLQGNVVATHALNGAGCDGIAWDAATNTFWVYDFGTDNIRLYDAAFNEQSSFLGPSAQGLGAGRGLAQIGEVVYVLCASRQIAMFDATGNAGSFFKYGLGCPTPSVIYELFSANTVDLTGTSLVFTPNMSGGYDVARCTSACFDTNLGTNLGMTDDMLSGPMPLGFPFPLPGGGTTTDIEISSNGFVNLVIGQSTGNGCCDGNVAEFLSGPPRISLLWQDLNPAAAPAGGGVMFNTIPGKATVTFSQVPEFGQNANPLTVQLQMFASGQFILNWQNAGNVTHVALVGYSIGNGVSDPGSIDLTASVPFSTVGGGIPVVLDCTSRPVLGGSVTLTTSNLPPGGVAGGTIVGTQRTSLPLGRFGALGCTLYSSGEITTIPINLTNPTITLAVPTTPALANLSLYLQSAVVVPTINSLNAVMSNGVELAFGPY